MKIKIKQKKNKLDVKFKLKKLKNNIFSYGKIELAQPMKSTSKKCQIYKLMIKDQKPMRYLNGLLQQYMESLRINIIGPTSSKKSLKKTKEPILKQDLEKLMQAQQKNNKF